MNSTNIPTIKIPVERVIPNAIIPTYAHYGDAGLDLHSAIDLVLQPYERVAVPTGIKIAIPLGYEGQVRPRSGLAIKHGITVLNSPGTIDSSYRGEIEVILINHFAQPFHIRFGDRIAQLVIAPVLYAPMVVVPMIDNDTERGTGGFGSTGV